MFLRHPPNQRMRHNPRLRRVLTLPPRWSACITGTGLLSVLLNSPFGFVTPAAIAAPLDCPFKPALERLQSHRVKPGESLAQIAQRYGLGTATLMGMNPIVRNGTVRPGDTLTIPPYNGIVVSLAPGQTLQTVARIYNVRPDLLLEVNGCQLSPKQAFVPGVNWSPLQSGTAIATNLPSRPVTQVDPRFLQDRYPLPQPAELRRPFGWQVQPSNGARFFSSGVELTAAKGTSVLAVTDGTVAFAGVQKPWGNVVVLNHAQGRQTRYGYLGAIRVQIGQRVQRNQILGVVGMPSALRFELRLRSALGWVAQDPLPYLRAIAGSNLPLL